MAAAGAVLIAVMLVVGRGGNVLAHGTAGLTAWQYVTFGVTATLSVPSRTYERGSLIVPMVTVVNKTNRTVTLRSNATRTSVGALAQIWVRQRSGRFAPSPFANPPPGSFGGPAGGDPLALPPHARRVVRQLVLLSGPILDVESDDSDIGIALRVHLTPPHPPRAVIAARPRLAATLVRPRGVKGPLIYQQWSHCHTSDPNLAEDPSDDEYAGRLEWERTKRNRVVAMLPSHCAGPIDWHVVAGWRGHSVRRITYRGR